MPPVSRKLPRSFYASDTLMVARSLVGMHLVHDRDELRQVGRIVETEAYLGPDDLAAHSAGGRRTARTEPMFGPPGHAYVYLIYGMWNCLNVVTESSGVPHAVLIRALEPVSGIVLPTHGPGLLCKALGIDVSKSGSDMIRGPLWIERPKEERPIELTAGPRIGVQYAQDWAKKPWRFFDRASPFVSTARRSVTRKPR